MLWQCFSDMSDPSSTYLSSRRNIKRIQWSRNLQGSFLNWIFGRYIFQEAHLVSHCISHYDINKKCTGNIIYVRRGLWLMHLLWTGWVSQQFCLANARVACGNSSICRKIGSFRRSGSQNSRCLRATQRKQQKQKGEPKEKTKQNKNNC